MSVALRNHDDYLNGDELYCQTNTTVIKEIDTVKILMVNHSMRLGNNVSELVLLR